MSMFKKILILPVLLVSFVALAETFFDQTFYSSSFMNEVTEVYLETRVPVSEPTQEKVITRKATKALPRMQRVLMSEASKINGKWEVIRVLNDKLVPVFDKNKNYDDKESKIVVNLNLIDMSKVRINDDVEQTFNISMMTKSGTIALFKPFGNGYEILEARKIIEDNSSKVVAKVNEVKLTKIEKRFETNQELVLNSALNPTKSGEILKNDKISGSIYLTGDQIMFENLSLHIGDKDETESLSFEAKIDGNTGHINYNNEIQGIVSVVGDKEIRVRFSTGPLANAMLNFKVPGSIDNAGQRDNYDIQQRGGRPVAPVALSAEKEEVEQAEEQESFEENVRETASYDDSEEVIEEDYSDEEGRAEVNVEEAGFEF